LKKEIHGIDLDNITEIIDVLENDTGLNKFWQDYSEKHSYSKNVKYLDVIDALKIIEKEIK
jgi:hypothetical protein